MLFKYITKDNKDVFKLIKNTPIHDLHIWANQFGRLETSLIYLLENKTDDFKLVDSIFNFRDVNQYKYEMDSFKKRIDVLKNQQKQITENYKKLINKLKKYSNKFDSTPFEKTKASIIGNYDPSKLSLIPTSEIPLIKNMDLMELHEHLTNGKTIVELKKSIL